MSQIYDKPKPRTAAIIIKCITESLVNFCRQNINTKITVPTQDIPKSEIFPFHKVEKGAVKIEVSAKNITAENINIAECNFKFSRLSQSVYCI